MDEYIANKKYESLKIPNRNQTRKGCNPSLSLENEDHQSWSGTKTNSTTSASDGMYYEIDYDSCPIPGVGKFVLKSQKIKEPEKDEVRDTFGKMRDIAREHRSAYDMSRFYDRLGQHENGVIFYKQGMFMKDFTDDFAGNTSFLRYFPEYQMMGYEQLRTYFTWRAEVRKGNVTDTSLSYGFLYIYELLNNIGVSSPQDGLDSLMGFWKAFAVYNQTINPYVLRWLKDYHIYYELSQTFEVFVKVNNLAEHYPMMADAGDRFNLFCGISKYDIRKSTFFTADRERIIKDCFYFIMSRLKQISLKNGIFFEELIFQQTNKMMPWVPFKDALFYQWKEQRDRRVVLAEKEVYTCVKNKWVFNKAAATESGKLLMGYIIKQMEVVLRKAMGYKYKLSVNIDPGVHETARRLAQAGFPLENIITSATMEFYREATKTVVRVDVEALSAIRREAMVTQEKLIVPEAEELSEIGQVSAEESGEVEQEPLTDPGETGQKLTAGPWGNLKALLTETEIKALELVLYREGQIKEFADSCGIMLEVLIDGINEKAMDCIGDNLMDEEMVLYDDYKERVKELIG